MWPPQLRCILVALRCPGWTQGLGSVAQQLLLWRIDFKRLASIWALETWGFKVGLVLLSSLKHYAGLSWPSLAAADSISVHGVGEESPSFLTDCQSHCGLCFDISVLNLVNITNEWAWGNIWKISWKSWDDACADWVMRGKDLRHLWTNTVFTMCLHFSNVLLTFLTAAASKRSIVILYCSVCMWVSLDF